MHRTCVDRITEQHLSQLALLNGLYTKRLIYSILVVLCLVMASVKSYAQSPIYTITADSLKPNGSYDLSTLLWKYQPGDVPSWASSSYDDANWSPIYTSLSSNNGPNVYWTGTGWFRINLKIDTSLARTPLNLRIQQFGASEIFLNGILIEKLGKISNVKSLQQNYVTFSPLPESPHETLPLKPDTTYVLAIRYSIHSLDYLHKIGLSGGFHVHLINMKSAVSRTINTYRHFYSYMMFLIGIALAIFLLHLMLYIFYPDKRSNLFYAILIGLYALMNLLQVYSNFTHNLSVFIFIVKLQFISMIIMTLIIIQFSNNLIEQAKRLWNFSAIIIGVILGIISWIYVLNARVFVYLFLLTVIVLVFWKIIYKFISQHKKDSYLIGFGMLVTLFLVGIQMLVNIGWISKMPGTSNGLLGSFSVLGIIISMSVYLAKDVADTNKDLKKKLGEVQELSRITIAQKEKETQLLLSTEREKSKAQGAILRAKTAELRLKIRQSENERRKKELEDARKLQLSMLPESLPQSEKFDLAFYMQTATEVGGDYYDYALSDDGTLTVAIGDATGHGLKAGTLVTAIKSLFQLLADQNDIRSIFHSMNQSVRQMNLGILYMGMTIAKLQNVDSGQAVLKISAAGMPPALIYHAESMSVEQLIMKGMPLGTKVDFPYEKRKLKLNSGDVLLLFSDGITELFNIEKEMFGITRLISVFKDLASLSSRNIIEELQKTISDWLNGKLPEDDITFIVAKVR